MKNSTRSVCVIGAGIVGLCCATFLQRAGLQVTLIDRGEPGRACSYGNAGILTATERGPIGLPGMFWKLPKWMLDPLGPMSVRPRHLPNMIDWGLALARASNKAEVERIADEMGDFFASAVDRYKDLLGSVGAGSLVRTSGYVCAYRDRTSAQGDDYFWDIHRRRGVILDELGSDELRQMLPGLSRDIRYGMFVPQEGRVLDPYAVSSAVFEGFIADGGVFLNEEVKHIDPIAGGATVIGSNTKTRFDHVVVAAGIWSKEIAARLGSRVLMESMRGYHAMLPEPGVELALPVLSGDHKFFASPMLGGLRLAGTAEFAGLDAPPNYHRADKLVAAAKTLFPQLNSENASNWMGHRPMTPDSLPVVGPSPNHQGIYFAFGHGHNGLSGAPMTGEVITRLITGQPAGINLEPFSIARFARGYKRPQAETDHSTRLSRLKLQQS